MLKHSLEDRKKVIGELKEFTEITQKTITSIASTLNWNPNNVGNINDYVTCPYNTSHRMGKNTIAEHLESCQWETEKYNATDLFFSEPSSFNPLCSIKFDAQLQKQVLKNAKDQDPTLNIENYQSCNRHGLNICLDDRLIPRTSDRLLADFTTDERRALYEYVIANTVKPEIGQDIVDGQQQTPGSKNEKQPTYLELLAQERNLKRRRAKHRGVHTNKKSQTEILREVINQQMEIFTDCLPDTQEVDVIEKSTDNKKSLVLREDESHQSLPRRRLNETSSSRHDDYSRSKQEFRDRKEYQETYVQPYEEHYDRQARYAYKKEERYQSRERRNSTAETRSHSSSEYRKKHRSKNRDHDEDQYYHFKHKSHKDDRHRSKRHEESALHRHKHHNGDRRKDYEKRRDRD